MESNRFDIGRSMDFPIGVRHLRIVEYTISEGMCPVGTWDAIRIMNLPLIGGPHTKRNGFVRAKLDLDDTVLEVWDWIDRRWIDARTARSVFSSSKTNTEVIA